MGENGPDIPGIEVSWMTRLPGGVAVKEAEAADPAGVGLFGPDGVVPEPTVTADVVEETGVVCVGRRSGGLVGGCVHRQRQYAAWVRIKKERVVYLDG